MKNIILAATCVVTLSAFATSGAFAQPSQGKAGSENGPTSNSTTTNGTGQPGMAGSSGSMATGGTTGTASPDASQQGAPTGAAVNSTGTATEPGKVKDGATR